jgi:hypothetical protein
MKRQNRLKFDLSRPRPGRYDRRFSAQSSWQCPLPSLQWLKLAFGVVFEVGCFSSLEFGLKFLAIRTGAAGPGGGVQATPSRDGSPYLFNSC